MEAFAIIGYMFGLRALEEVRRLKSEQETVLVKEKWKRELCSQGRHFSYCGKCSACGIDLLNQLPEKR